MVVKSGSNWSVSSFFFIGLALRLCLLQLVKVRTRPVHRFLASLALDLLNLLFQIVLEDRVVH